MTTKHVFYCMEVENPNSFSKASKIEAANLASAKRIASHNRVFVGTTLVIGNSVNSQGFVTEPVCVKVSNEKWKTVAEEPNALNDDGDEICAFITGKTLDDCYIEIRTRDEVRAMAGMLYAPWEDEKLTAFADGIGYNCDADEIENYIVDKYGDAIAEFLQECYADNVAGYDPKADCETPHPFCAPWTWAKDWFVKGSGGFLISALIVFAMDVCNDNAIHEAFREVTE